MWTPVHSVLPFVLLGLGVDDSFVIVNAFDRTNRKDPIPVRMQSALAHAATSITVTSLTDFVAFAISTSSELPALSSFCMYAAVTIFVLFALQVTFFAAFVCLDQQRQLAKRTDCCPCCSDCCVRTCLATPCCQPAAADGGVEEGDRDGGKDKMAVAEEFAAQGNISYFFEHRFCPVLLSRAGKGATLVGFIVLLGICCGMGVPNLQVEDGIRNFVPDGSYLGDTLDKNDQYFGDAGIDVYLVTKKIDYYALQSDYAALKDNVEALSSKYLLSPTDEPSSYDNWYDSFTAYCGSEGLTGYDTNEDTFYEHLHIFLQSDRGGFYNASIVFEDHSTIAAARVRSEFKSLNKYYKGRLQVNAEKAVAAMLKVREYAYSVNAMAFSYDFLSWETFRIIARELYLNVALCLVAVFVITTLLIGHPGCSTLVFISVAMTVLDILGCMYFWGLFIDSVSVMQTVIAIGLCVDYAAHVAHSFMLKVGTRDERVTAALADIGAAVLNGGLSTFLAVMLLAGSKSYVFRVLFQQFFLTVVLGLGHGMIFLPVLLSLMGPPCYAAVEEAAARAAEKQQGVGSSTELTAVSEAKVVA